ncbi:hypothetical protein, conserved in T. vivax [Trypanosoma vivax Y486]|uniref:Retrotransposon hot spot (RHS) protein n=1 Tax=Trypanosoma vivax (strain Y486) TaxID=1055687 RepID=F9WMX1_TRYVY|nr:hypothetical protein, conserved in T. vivax [Trypanosoma vivax Y486]|eukprot:CCD18885.1 hypothetical protein, conserved in T. vivax [Trypanosoma vivax Y486]
MAERNQLALTNEGADPGGPPLMRARVESVPGPQWTLSSDVLDVLLRGSPPPDNQKLSSFIAYLGILNVELAGDVQMSVFVNEPEFYIPDEHGRRRVLSLSECRTYALVYRAVPLLRGHRITSVRRWGGPDENTDAKRAVRDALADERLWNTVCGLLDDAYNVAKDADEKEKIERERERSIAKVIEVEGLYDSVVNATWAYVKSGDTDGPLGMKIYVRDESGNVIGPEMLWREEEVNFFNTPDSEVDEQCDREDGIEIFVLTSRMGWPYMVYRGAEQASTSPSKEFYRGVFVRREVVRVWYIVKNSLDVMHGEATDESTHRLTLIGSPGIGKSYSVGAFLLYMLLR